MSKGFRQENLYRAEMFSALLPLLVVFPDKYERELPHNSFCFNVIPRACQTGSYEINSGSLHAQCPHHPFHTRQLLPMLSREDCHLEPWKEEKLRVQRGGCDGSGTAAVERSL